MPPTSFRPLLPPFALLAVLVACSPRDPGEPFVDASAATGLDHRHENGMSGRRYFSEVVGPGAAFLDYDLDGDLDLYLVQGGDPDPAGDDAQRPRDVLLRNDLTTEGARWTDVTGSSGIDARGYGMGVAVGDVDGDGDPDLYVTNFGANQLWVNRGDGTFEDLTTPSLAEPRWSTSATFLDYDLDGDLDLFAANYVEYRISQHRPCLNAAGALEYCGPSGYPPETDRLWRNRGDGSFEDVTGVSGIIDRAGSGLGVVSADFDGDLLPDLYVANDLMPNFLWINQGDGTFREDALLAGCAVNENGAPEASMGLAVADFDRDGDEDVFMTHLDTETNTAYANDGSALFADASNEWGLAVPSLGLTGFGTAAVDYDNDGWLDLVAVNGAVKTIAEQRIAGDPLPLRQRDLLLRNEDGRFREVTHLAPALLVEHVSRGLTVGDFDNDGDDDVVILNNDGPARLLRNEVGQRYTWLGVNASLTSGGPALGSRVRLLGELDSSRTVRAGLSYCSSADPRVRLGGVDRAGALEIATPRGRRWRLTEPPTRRYLEVPLE